jgi:excinuclease UvrABC nuclease subunit
MSHQTSHLDFDGYWREPNVTHIPAASGIYCVYTATHNRSANTVTLHTLVYIGESANVRDRIASQERWNDWRRHLLPGQQLAFSCAKMVTGRERAEAAMINHHKPPENSEYVHSFPFDRTTVRTTGQNALLSSYFTVEPSRQPAYSW